MEPLGPANSGFTDWFFQRHGSKSVGALVRFLCSSSPILFLLGCSITYRYSYWCSPLTAKRDLMVFCSCCVPAHHNTWKLCWDCFHSISILLVKEENTMIILRNPQIAELIEPGCAFKSNVIISKNVEQPWQCARRCGSISETAGSVILYETLTPGYAMLMSPKQDETAVHGCHFTGTLMCACVKVRPDRGDL